MVKPVYQIFLSAIVALSLWLWNPPAIQAQTNPEELAKAVQEIETLDAMRSNLASTLEGRSEAPTKQTFKEVCKPVGMRAKQLACENGWEVKQIAEKYRNPAHAADSPQFKNALAKFEQNPELICFWERESVNGQSGTRYYRRINVEASCLACHGAKSSRPEFVKENYPEDRAFNFNVGDLRGMYEAFIPDRPGVIQDVLPDRYLCSEDQ
jgi:hypothetical protein